MSFFSKRNEPPFQWNPKIKKTLFQKKPGKFRSRARIYNVVFQGVGNMQFYYFFRAFLFHRIPPKSVWRAEYPKDPGAHERIPRQGSGSPSPLEIRIPV